MDDFLNTWPMRFWVRPFLDIAILSWLLYSAYRILVQTRAVALLRGIGFLLLVYGFSWLFRLETVSWLVNLLAPSLFFGLFIVFQPEIRRIFTQIGQGGPFGGSGKVKAQEIEAIMTAVEYLSGMRFGALMVFTRRIGLKDYVQKVGTPLNAELSSNLLIALFFKDNPLHDGAVVISGDKIQSAGVFLPLTEQPDIRKQFGTRHRAALGLAEETDAVVLVVSEETGAISLAYNGQLYYNLGVKETRRRLQRLLQNLPVEDQEDEALDERAV